MFESLPERVISSPAVSLSIAIGLLLLWPVLGEIRNYAKLRHIPGPLLSHFTGLWVSIKLWRGESFLDINRKLDQQYGPVVCYGPKHVLFSDPSAIPVIYGTNNVFIKVNTMNDDHVSCPELTCRATGRVL